MDVSPRHDIRVAPWLLALLAAAGCGGSGAGAPATSQRAGTPATSERAGRVVSGEVRTPDARTPLVRGPGRLWRCETP